MLSNYTFCILEIRVNFHPAILDFMQRFLSLCDYKRRIFSLTKGRVPYLNLLSLGSRSRTVKKKKTIYWAITIRQRESKELISISEANKLLWLLISWQFILVSMVDIRRVYSLQTLSPLDHFFFIGNIN